MDRNSSLEYCAFCVLFAQKLAVKQQCINISWYQQWMYHNKFCPEVNRLRQIKPWRMNPIGVAFYVQGAKKLPRVRETVWTRGGSHYYQWFLDCTEINGSHRQLGLTSHLPNATRPNKNGSATVAMVFGLHWNQWISQTTRADFLSPRCNQATIVPFSYSMACSLLCHFLTFLFLIACVLAQVDVCMYVDKV